LLTCTVLATPPCPPGVLHTIFFHRYFPCVVPGSRPVLSVELPYVDDEELETLIEQRVMTLEQQLNSARSSTRAGGGGTAIPSSLGLGGGASPTLSSAAANNNNAGGRGEITIQYFERKRRKGVFMRGDEEVCWERWIVKVTVAEPKTENGTFSVFCTIHGLVISC
jgi:autophagy-related protein 101